MKARNLRRLICIGLVAVCLVGRAPIGAQEAARPTVQAGALPDVHSIVGNRLPLNMSPDLILASYVQYDTVSESIGANTRLQSRFRPVGDLFIVYNHNVRSLEDRWQLDSNQLLVKLQYAWRL